MGVNQHTGLFLTLEGGEGTGKSTLAIALASAFEALDRTVLVTREPGGSDGAEALRTLLLSPPSEDWDPLTQALIVNAARRDHLHNRIVPALQDNSIVISDRFLDSTRVYQGHVQGVDAEYLHQLEAMILMGRVPDMTILLDADPSALLDRRSGRGTNDHFEAQPLAFHQQVRDGFLKIAEAEPQRFLVLDALQSTDDLVAAIMAELQKRRLMIEETADE